MERLVQVEKPYGIWRPSRYKLKAYRDEGKKLSQKEQSERFKETAREVGADLDKGSFGRAIKVLLPSVKP